MSMKQIILSFSFGQCFLKKSAQKSWLYVCNSKFGEMYYIKVKHGIWYDCNPPSPTYLGKIFWCSFHYPKVPLKPVPPPHPPNLLMLPMPLVERTYNLKSYLLCQTISHHFRLLQTAKLQFIMSVIYLITQRVAIQSQVSCFNTLHHIILSWEQTSAE
jgi:hypothetical protein